MKKTFPASLASAAFLLVPGAALAQMTGTSHPEDLNDTISTAPAQTPHYAKPSPAVPLASTDTAPPPTTPSQPVLVQRVPPPSFQAAEPAAPAPLETARASRADSEFLVTDDPDSGVVLDVPSARNELAAGTLVHVSLLDEISTVVTQRGDTFTGRLTQPLLRRHEVLVPAGSILTGRVAQVHGGNRLHGGPVIQLVAESVTLPDGAKHHLQAQVVDLPFVTDARVNDEGVIRGKDNLKGAAAGVGLTTASATVAGAVIGGGVGAAVGATVGLGVATVWYLRHEQEQTLPKDTEVVFSLDRPLTVSPAER